MAFDAGMLACALQELREESLGARVEKVYQPERDEIHLLIRAQGANHRLVLSASANAARVHLSEHAKTGLERSDLVAELMSIERKTCLETERVTATESARNHARCKEFVPHLIDCCMRSIDLESVLSCIAGTAYDHACAFAFCLIICIERECGSRGKTESLNCIFLCFRALESDLSP